MERAFWLAVCFGEAGAVVCLHGALEVFLKVYCVVLVWGEVKASSYAAAADINRTD